LHSSPLPRGCVYPIAARSVRNELQTNTLRVIDGYWVSSYSTFGMLVRHAMVGISLAQGGGLAAKEA
jgi:hypothetical protein